jgi:hypothetical protein
MTTQTKSGIGMMAGAVLSFALLAGTVPTDAERALLGRTASVPAGTVSAETDPQKPTGADALLNNGGTAPTAAGSVWPGINLADRALQGRVR